ncbi:MAG: alpha/beta hydrolase [Agriterribacter sp.]
MSNLKSTSLLIAIFIMPFCAVSNNNTIVNYSIEEVANGTIYVILQKSNRYTFDSARYTIFIPANTPELQSVFVHQHGCTMEGRGSATAYDVQYQAFAKKWKLAVVGADLYSAKGNCHDWRNAESGSGESLIKSLQEIGTQSGHPELATLPWLLLGHSGGGYWALSMLRMYPERILGIFGYSPAFEPGAYPKAALKVPVMMRHAGPVGDACCWQTSIKEFHKLRSAGGYTSIAYTPYQNHNFSYVRYIAIPFFEAVMKQRLSVSAGPSYTAMRNMDSTKAWLGDTVSYNIYKAAAYPGNKLSAAWLPDSITATKWREYVITGTVIDRTPPPAPYGVQIRRRHNVTIELTWKADADIESGISHFNIYKDNQLIGRFPNAGFYQQFNTNGDDAYPLQLPALRTDVTLLWNDTGKISVSTVNHFGLESERTTIP